jgi:sporulation protein YlmC with PRC-barrel domain
MEQQTFLDIIRQVLDRQVIDANHVPCGKVDDIEIEGVEELRITALLIGNGAACRRLPELFRFISEKIFGTAVTKVPWSEVMVITDEIKLKSRADALGLDESKTWAYKIIGKLPGASRK